MTNQTDPLDETLKNMEGKQMPHLINGENWWPESYLNAEIAKAVREARIDEQAHTVSDYDGNIYFSAKKDITESVTQEERLAQLKEDE